MTLVARLEPRRDPNETLMDSLSERPPLSISSMNRDQLTLGRGQRTGISDRTIGPEVVNISFDESCMSAQCVKVTLMKDSERCRVHVNGQPWRRNCWQDSANLKSGDIISLDNLRYEYKIHISREGDFPANELAVAESVEVDAFDAFIASTFQDDSLEGFPESEKIKSEDVISLASTPEPPSRSPEPTADTEVAASIPLVAETASRLSDEIQCSVCLDIQVHPRTLNPCGHSFCASCLEKLEQCPQCRKTIESHVPARQLDSLVSLLVTIPKLLGEDDVKHYYERKKKNTIVHSATSTAKRPPKRQRRDPGFYYPPLGPPVAPPFPPFPASEYFHHQNRMSRATHYESVRGVNILPSPHARSISRNGRHNNTQPTPHRTTGNSVADAICID